MGRPRRVADRRKRMVALIKMSAAIFAFLVLLSLPLLFLRFMERRSGDPLWLYHKVFRNGRP